MSQPAEFPRTLPGGFRLHRLIGEGGHARVFEATDAQGQSIAIKLLRSDHEGARTRFEREIKVLKALPQNPHIVRFHSEGLDSNGRPFFAMELISGYTLGALLASGTTLAPKVAAKLMLQLCTAFGKLHQLGVAHGDINPQNVMISSDGQTAKLLDFGLVRDAQGLLALMESEDMLDGSHFQRDIDAGVLMGSPRYMAPEQFGDALEPGKIARTDTQADVFGLGVLLLELLTGTTPWPFQAPKGNGREWKKAVLAYGQARLRGTMEAPSRGTIPRGLWQILLRSLRRDLKERFCDARELKRAIEYWLRTGEAPVSHKSEQMHTLRPRAVPASSRPAKRPKPALRPRPAPAAKAPKPVSRPPERGAIMAPEAQGIEPASGPNPAVWVAGGVILAAVIIGLSKLF